MEKADARTRANSEMPETPPGLRDFLVPIDSLTPHDRNARRGNVTELAKSLQRWGQYRPIVVNRRTGKIVAGNHTWLAAKELGWQDIAATWIDVDEEDELRILLVDNRLSDIADYNNDSLIEILREIEQSEEGLTDTGFSLQDLEKLVQKIDEVAAEEVPGWDERYEVVVECQNENDQMAILQRLANEGLKVRAIVV